MNVKQSQSDETDAVRAVAELAHELGRPEQGAVIFFCSPDYDLPTLGRALADTFRVPLVGCTTAGQIGRRGFQPNGIVAASVSSDRLIVHPYLISGLKDCDERVAAVSKLSAEDGLASEVEDSFGLLLVDGLSLSEEKLISALYASSGAMPIVGGSAGDDLAFRRTAVYHDGAFHSDAATLTVFRNVDAFATMKFHHFEPTARRLVVTSASPAKRIVHEFDGLPAIEAYAEAVGRAPSEIDPATCSAHPLMLRVGDDYYVRSICEVLPNGDVALFCSIDEGTVVALGRPLDPVMAARGAFDAARAQVGDPKLVIGCDCILRRLELEKSGLVGAVGETFAGNNVIGFSTYGEQFNSLHINQTFTGIAIG